MSEPKKAITDSSLARMAGNIAAGMVPRLDVYDPAEIAKRSVELAVHISDELDRFQNFRRQSAETETP